MSDILDKDFSAVNVSPFVKLSTQQESRGLFTSCYAFWRYLHAFDWVDVMTYTYDDNVAANINVRRLLFTRTNKATMQAKEVRQVANNHAKLYLCYFDRLAEVYVGSWNLVAPTFLEVMIEARKQHHKPLAKFFNDVWNAADPTI